MFWVTEQDLGLLGPKKGPKQTQNSTRAIFRAQTVQILKWGPKNPSKIAPNGPKWLPIVSTSPVGSYTLPQYMIKVLWDPKKGPKHTQNSSRDPPRTPLSRKVESWTNLAFNIPTVKDELEPRPDCAGTSPL